MKFSTAISSAIATVAALATALPAEAIISLNGRDCTRDQDTLLKLAESSRGAICQRTDDEGRISTYYLQYSERPQNGLYVGEWEMQFQPVRNSPGFHTVLFSEFSDVLVDFDYRISAAVIDEATQKLYGNVRKEDTREGRYVLAKMGDNSNQTLELADVYATWLAARDNRPALTRSGTTTDYRISAYRSPERDQAAFTIPASSRVEILAEAPSGPLMSVKIRYRGKIGWIYSHNAEY